MKYILTTSLDPSGLDLKDTVIDIPENDGWIKCSDRLPENKHVVLVYNKFNEMHVCKMDRNVNNYIFMLNDTSLQIRDVTHWMPLPEPPK